MPTSSPTVLLVRRRAGCPHPAARNCTATHEKTLSLRRHSAPVAICLPQRRGFYVSDGSLSFFGKRKGGKNAAKTKVLESFSRLGCRPRRSPLTSRTGMCKICTLLSYGLCAAIRWPLTRTRAALAQQRYPLCLPCYAQHFLSSFRRGRCPHRPALPRNLQHSVGVGLPDDPNRAPTVPAAGHMGPSYKVLRCRRRADRGVRPCKGNGFPHRCAHWFGMTG